MWWTLPSPFGGDAFPSCGVREDLDLTVHIEVSHQCVYPWGMRGALDDCIEFALSAGESNDRLS